MRRKYICSGCGAHYGPLVPGRQTYGFCAACWALHLAQMAANGQRLWLDWCRQKGWTPEVAS